MNSEFENMNAYFDKEDLGMCEFYDEMKNRLGNVENPRWFPWN